MAWLRRKAPRRKYALAAILVCLSLVLTIKLGEWRYNADLDAKILDVGQGQCVLLASDGDFTLVDCGSGNSWYGPGDTASLDGQPLQGLAPEQLAARLQGRASATLHWRRDGQPHTTVLRMP